MKWNTDKKSFKRIHSSQCLKGKFTSTQNSIKCLDEEAQRETRNLNLRNHIVHPLVKYYLVPFYPNSQNRSQNCTSSKCNSLILCPMPNKFSGKKWQFHSFLAKPCTIHEHLQQSTAHTCKNPFWWIGKRDPP